ARGRLPLLTRARAVVERADQSAALDVPYGAVAELRRGEAAAVGREGPFVGQQRDRLRHELDRLHRAVTLELGDRSRRLRLVDGRRCRGLVTGSEGPGERERGRAGARLHGATISGWRSGWRSG